MKSVCFFCSSSDAVDEDYFDKAYKIGSIFASNKFTLVYGAGGVGLMGAVANSFYDKGVSITGIIPEKLNKTNIVFDKIQELIITKTMSERKSLMIEKSDGFIALPGGFGTLEEIFEVITLKQLGYIDKPIIFYNYKNFYGYLLEQLEHIYKERFAKEVYREVYIVTDDINYIYHYFINYKPFKAVEKWFC